MNDILQQLEKLKGDARQQILTLLRARLAKLSVPPPKKVLILRRNVRGTKAETVERPQYMKWAISLLNGIPLRILTTHGHPLCLFPSSIFGGADKGGLPEGSLIVTYAGDIYHGVAEMIFDEKKPNPYWLKARGFPLSLSVLICKTIYTMFPHLNPLSAEDIDAIRASEKRRGAVNALRLTTPKRKHVRTQPETSEEIEHKFKAAKPVTAKPVENQNHDRSTKQRKSSRKTRSGETGITDSGSDTKGAEKLPDVSGGERVRDSRKGKRGSKVAGQVLSEPAAVLPPTGEGK